MGLVLSLFIVMTSSVFFSSCAATVSCGAATSVDKESSRLTVELVNFLSFVGLLGTGSVDVTDTVGLS